MLASPTRRPSLCTPTAPFEPVVAQLLHAVDELRLARRSLASSPRVLHGTEQSQPRQPVTCPVRRRLRVRFRHQAPHAVLGHRAARRFSCPSMRSARSPSPRAPALRSGAPARRSSPSGTQLTPERGIRVPLVGRPAHRALDRRRRSIQAPPSLPAEYPSSAARRVESAGVRGIGSRAVQPVARPSRDRRAAAVVACRRVPAGGRPRIQVARFLEARPIAGGGVPTS